MSRFQPFCESSRHGGSEVSTVDPGGYTGIHIDLRAREGKKRKPRKISAKNRLVRLKQRLLEEDPRLKPIVETQSGGSHSGESKSPLDTLVQIRGATMHKLKDLHEAFKRHNLGNLKSVRHLRDYIKTQFGGMKTLADQLKAHPDWSTLRDCKSQSGKGRKLQKIMKDVTGHKVSKSQVKDLVSKYLPQSAVETTEKVQEIVSEGPKRVKKKVKKALRSGKRNATQMMSSLIGNAVEGMVNAKVQDQEQTGSGKQRGGKSTWKKLKKFLQSTGYNLATAFGPMIDQGATALAASYGMPLPQGFSLSEGMQKMFAPGGSQGMDMNAMMMQMAGMAGLPTNQQQMMQMAQQYANPYLQQAQSAIQSNPYFQQAQNLYQALPSPTPTPAPTPAAPTTASNDNPFVGYGKGMHGSGPYDPIIFGGGQCGGTRFKKDINAFSIGEAKRHISNLVDSGVVSSAGAKDALAQLARTMARTIRGGLKGSLNQAQMGKGLCKCVDKISKM